MKSKYLLLMGCSILILAACGNTATTEPYSTEDILSTEYIQDTESETEADTIVEVEETIESTEIEETIAPTEAAESAPENDTNLVAEKPEETNSTNANTSNTKAYTVEDLDGDGYADLGKTTEFNGFLLLTDQVTVDTAKLFQTVSNAGFYNPVPWSNGCVYMIVPYGEWDTGADWLDAWLESQGLNCAGIGGGDYDLGSRAEMVYASKVY